jgi:hypothetical protein
MVGCATCGSSVHGPAVPAVWFACDVWFRICVFLACESHAGRSSRKPDCVQHSSAHATNDNVTSHYTLRRRQPIYASRITMADGVLSVLWRVVCCVWEVAFFWQLVRLSASQFKVSNIRSNANRCEATMGLVEAEEQERSASRYC